MKEMDRRMKITKDCNKKIYNNIIKSSPGANIYCHCVYEGRDIPKNLGFKWNPNLKVWYMPKKDFTYEIYKNSQVVRYRNYTKIGPLDYYYVHYITGDINVYVKRNLKFQKIDEDSIEFRDD